MAQPATNSPSWGDSGDDRTTDAELVALVLNGRQDAFEALFDRYARQVYTLAYRISGHAAEAEDLTQDIFLRAFRTLGSLRQPQAFAAWLYQLATNVCLDAVRRRRVPHADLSEAVIASYPDDSRWWAPEVVAVADDDRRAVWETLGRLAASQRAALTLRELYGLTYGEIAAALGMSVGAVEVLVFRARRRFREQYERVAAGAGGGPTERVPRCQDVRASLAAVLDDEESEGKARAAALTHVRGCAACQAEIAALRRNNRARLLLPLLPVPVALKGHVIVHLGALIGPSIAGMGAPPPASTLTTASGATGSGAAAAAGGTTGAAAPGASAGATALGAKAMALVGTKALLIAAVTTTATVATLAVPLLRRHHTAVTRQAVGHAGQPAVTRRPPSAVLTPLPRVVAVRLAPVVQGTGHSGRHTGVAAAPPRRAVTPITRTTYALPRQPPALPASLSRRAAAPITQRTYALPHQPPALPVSLPSQAPVAVGHRPQPRSTHSLHPGYQAPRVTPHAAHPTRVAPHAAHSAGTTPHPRHIQTHPTFTTRRTVPSSHHAPRRYHTVRPVVHHTAAHMPLAAAWPSGHLLHFDRREVLRLRTVSDASVVVALQIIGLTDPHSRGPQGARVYRFTLSARANGHGDATIPLRYAYVPTRPAPVNLTVTVQAGRHTTRQRVAMTLVRH